MRRDRRCSAPFVSLAVVILALWLSLPLQAVPIPPSTMRQWDIKDIVLCAQTAYPDWQSYQGVRVTARFDGPNSTTLFVNGFWDGKNVAPCSATAQAFRVRFNPHLQGTWNFSISNNQGDLGLTVMPAEAGTITVISPGPSAAGKTPRGFLRRDSAAGNPSASFIWATGDHQFLWGQTYYQIVNREVSGDPSWKTAVDNSTAATSMTYNMNKIRFLIAPWNQNGGTVDSQPYKQTNNVLNRDQLNIPHWQALDRIVQYLNERNVVAEIILVNSPELLGTPLQDCRYLRYAVSRYAAYPNVTWSLANEWELVKHDPSYWNDLGCVIRGCPQTTCTGPDFSTPADPWFTNGGKSRALTIHPAHRYPPGSDQFQFCFEFAGESWPVHASLQSHKRNKDITNPPTFQGDRRGYESIACNRAVVGAPSPCALPPSPLPVVNDEYGYVGVAAQTPPEHRNVIWGTATGGGYGTAGDLRGDPDSPIVTTEWKLPVPTEYDDIKRLVSFFTSATKAVEFWKMGPQTPCQANTRVHTLAQPGRQYVVYTADGLPFSVTNFTLGQYQRIWYNPRTANPNDPNAGIDQGCVNITNNSFTPPGGSPGDWVLLLKKTPTCP